MRVSNIKMNIEVQTLNFSATVLDFEKIQLNKFTNSYNLTEVVEVLVCFQDV